MRVTDPRVSFLGDSMMVSDNELDVVGGRIWNLVKDVEAGKEGAHAELLCMIEKYPESDIEQFSDLLNRAAKAYDAYLQAQRCDYEEIAESVRERVLEDLRENGCRKAAAALDTLNDVEDTEAMIDVLRDFGCVHANRHRLKQETINYVDESAEAATAFLFDVFWRDVQEAKILFKEAAKSRKEKKNLRATSIHKEAVSLIRKARRFAFGDKEDWHDHGSFGGPGYAALSRMMEKGTLPKAINERLMNDQDFAEDVNGNGKSLLKALMAPPKRKS